VKAHIVYTDPMLGLIPAEVELGGISFADYWLDPALYLGRILETLKILPEMVRSVNLFLDWNEICYGCKRDIPSVWLTKGECPECRAEAEREQLKTEGYLECDVCGEVFPPSDVAKIESNKFPPATVCDGCRAIETFHGVDCYCEDCNNERQEVLDDLDRERRDPYSDHYDPYHAQYASPYGHY
jgi:hypothetical protein